MVAQEIWFEILPYDGAIPKSRFFGSDHEGDEGVADDGHGGEDWPPRPGGHEDEGVGD